MDRVQFIDNLEGYLTEYLEASFEDARELMKDKDHEREGVECHISDIRCSNGVVCVTDDCGRLHIYRAKLERIT